MFFVRPVVLRHTPSYGACCVLCPNVCGMTEQGSGRRVPADSFRIRLAIVRTEMGWNYDQAEAATGVGSESWRQWEKGLRHCTDVKSVSRKIAEVTPYDPVWLVMGGPLAAEEDEDELSRPRRARSAVGRRVASTRRVTTPSNRGCVTTTRVRERHHTVCANAA